MSDAFNQDHHVQSEFRRLVDKWSVETIIETGTYHGQTTEYLASLGPVVHTIEIREDYREEALARVGGLPNVTSHLGNSPEVLERILPTLAGPVLVFLDAHWQAYCPLRDELRLLALHFPNRAIVAIHDFKVPGRDFGYDRWEDRDLELALIEDLLPALYPAGYEHHYNELAEGARRGVIYIEPTAG